MSQQYEVVVPQGVGPGQPFQVNIGGSMMQAHNNNATPIYHCLALSSPILIAIAQPHDRFNVHKMLVPG